MASLNLSLPDDLKERMSAANLNWSALAKEAFINALDIEDMKATGKIREAGIARLRESKRKNTEREHAEGAAAGREWALDAAEYDDLKPVADLADEERDDVADALCHTLHEASYDIEACLGTINPSEAFAEGFVAGVAEVLAEV